jgi:hypothetical protein
MCATANHIHRSREPPILRYDGHPVARFQLAYIRHPIEAFWQEFNNSWISTGGLLDPFFRVRRHLPLRCLQTIPPAADFSRHLLEQSSFQLDMDWDTVVLVSQEK